VQETHSSVLERKKDYNCFIWKWFYFNIFWWPQVLSIIHLIPFNLSSYEQTKHLFYVTCLHIFPPVGKQAGNPSPALPLPPSISNKKSFSFALQFVALSLHTVQVIRAFKYQPSIQDFECMKFESDLSCDQLPKVGTDLLIPSGKKNSAIHLLYLPPNQILYGIIRSSDIWEKDPGIPHLLLQKQTCSWPSFCVPG
jgi:hypothetical protein